MVCLTKVNVAVDMNSISKTWYKKEYITMNYKSSDICYLISKLFPVLFESSQLLYL